MVVADPLADLPQLIEECQAIIHLASDQLARLQHELGKE